jgi:NitT/TauT family transport system ATP-binding protein
MRAVTDENTNIPKIQIQALSKSYPGDKNPVLALRAVDISINEGEFVSIVGPSGCGKSTLLYVLGGFLEADGKVLVDGKAIQGPGTDRGVVFQEYALFPWLSVRNNILYGLERGALAPDERAPSRTG